MWKISRNFITCGELLCFLFVWLIGLVVVFADHGRQSVSTENSVAATNFVPDNHSTLE